jgi:hypothetical protein
MGIVGEPVIDCGLLVRYEAVGPSVIISPGGGRLGSLSCKFMRTVERRRPVYDGCRFRGAELLDDPK